LICVAIIIWKDICVSGFESAVLIGFSNIKRRYYIPWSAFLSRWFQIKALCRRYRRMLSPGGLWLISFLVWVSYRTVKKK